MSAFVVSRAHINALIHTALMGPAGVPVDPGNGWRISGYSLKWTRDPERDWMDPERCGELRADTADDVGRMLEAECIESVTHRYPDCRENPANLPGTIGERDEPFSYSPALAKRLTAVEGLKALACFEYQSCEHPGWESSEAYAFCDSLRHALIGQLPGYAAADWEVRNPRIAA